jgi:hypothetical protein
MAHGVSNAVTFAKTAFLDATTSLAAAKTAERVAGFHRSNVVLVSCERHTVLPNVSAGSEIRHFVMAITSLEAVVRHPPSCA